MDIDYDDDDDDVAAYIPTMKVSDLQKLDDHCIQKMVSYQVLVKKFDEKKNWCSPFCISCEKDLHEVAGLYQCRGRIFEYPDISLCFDESGTRPIVWPNHEISHLADPAYSEPLRKRNTKFTIQLNEEI
ncbi:uncharacterized protein LOC141672231 isoform X2 [Apium graveolens]|uniref:uncharacterized protein LOC141672231 isoform X2 n=1 Tax=Apium graveolens TaxID=4045 RepID=UPI003D7BAFC8